MNNESFWWYFLQHVSDIRRSPDYRYFRRWFAGIFVGVVLFGGVFGAQWYWVHRKFVHYRHDGLAAARAGNVNVAIEYLSAYLARYPDDEETLVAYCHIRPSLTDARGRHISETISALQRLLLLDGEHCEQRRTLMRLYLKQGSLGAASQEAAKLLTRFPNDAEAMGIRMRDLVRRKQLSDALALDVRWRRIAPVDLPTELALIALMHESRIPDAQIVARCDSDLATHPDDPAIWVLASCGYSTSSAGEPQKQAELLSKTMQRLDSDVGCAKDGILVAALVEQLDNHGRFSDSLSVLRRWADASGEPKASWALGRRLWIAGRWSEAAGALSAITPDVPTDILALSEICAANAGTPDKADHARSELDHRQGEPAAIWKAIATWATSESSADAAVSLIKMIRNAPALSGGAMGESAATLWYFEGEAESVLGETDLALQAWAHAADLSPAWSLPDVRAVPVFLEIGRWPAALQAAAEAKRRAPEDLPVMVVLAQAWAAALDHSGPNSAGLETLLGNEGASLTHERLWQLVDSILKQAPREEAIVCLRIELLAKDPSTRAQGNAAIDAAIQMRPSLSAATLLRLASISHATSMEKEQACLIACENAHGSSPELALARSAYLLYSSQKAAALQVFNTAEARPSNPAVSHDDELKREVARARFLDLAEDPGARTAMMALADGYPNSLSAQQTAIHSRSAWGDHHLLHDVVVRIRRLTGSQGLQWQLAKARLLIADAQTTDAGLKEATELLQQVLRVAPQCIEAHVLQAELLAARWDLDGAIREWSSAVSLAPGEPGIAISLARAHRESGDISAAEHTLEWLESRPPTQAGERGRLALILAECGHLSRAIEILEQPQATFVPEQATRNALLLAGLYRDAGRFQDAEKLCQSLAEAPNLAMVVFTAELLAAQGKNAEALAALDSLASLHLPAGEQQLARADHVRHFEGAEMAIPLYRQACREAPKNAAAWKRMIACLAMAGRVSDAESAAADGAVAVPADVVLLTLHSHSDLLSPASDPDLRTLVSAAIQNPEEDAPAVRAIRILANKRQPPATVTEQLEELADRYPALLPLQLITVKREIAEHRLGPAVTAAQRTARIFPNLADPCRWLFTAHAASNDWLQAMVAVEQWRARVGSAPMAQSQVFDAEFARAQCLFHLGRPEEAASALEPFCERAIADPGTNGSWIRLYAMSRLANPQETTIQQLRERLGPLLATAAGKETWVDVAEGFSNAGEADAWLSIAANAIKPEEIAPRLKLAGAWHRLQPCPKCAAAERAALAPLIDRPSPLPRAMLTLAIYAQDEGDNSAAESGYRCVLGLSEGDDLAMTKPVAANKLAELIMHRSPNETELAEALHLANEAAAAQPDNASFHDTLANLYSKRKDYRRAVDEWGQSVRLEPKAIRYQVRLAQAMADGGDVDAARRLARQAQSNISAADSSEKVLPEPERRQLQTLLKLPDITSSRQRKAEVK